jgi:quercetin dioxygenase-like cupin family protein
MAAARRGRAVIAQASRRSQIAEFTQETIVKTSVVVLVLTLTAVAAGVSGQQPAFKRTVLQQVDLSVPGREAVTAVAELQPGAAAGRHTHPGEEIGYVIEGTVLVEVDGKPPMTLTGGKAFLIPAGAIHNATNKGSSAARVLATYIIEKGKPVATPAATK